MQHKLFKVRGFTGLCRSFQAGKLHALSLGPLEEPLRQIRASYQEFCSDEEAMIKREAFKAEKVRRKAEEEKLRLVSVEPRFPCLKNPNFS